MSDFMLPETRSTNAPDVGAFMLPKLLFGEKRKPHWKGE